MSTQQNYEQRVSILLNHRLPVFAADIKPKDMYTIGYGHARMDAAEIAARADARILELEKALDDAAVILWNNSLNSGARAAEKALGRPSNLEGNTLAAD